MNNIIFPYNAQGHQSHQTIFVISLMIIKITADVGNAQGVSIAGNPRHHAVVDPFGLVFFDLAKAERIGASNDFGAHAHHIPDIPTNTRSSTFIWNNLRWVIMRFMTHDHAPAVAVIVSSHSHHTGIFLGAQDHIRSSGGELF